MPIQKTEIVPRSGLSAREIPGRRKSAWRGFIALFLTLPLAAQEAGSPPAGRFVVRQACALPPTGPLPPAKAPDLSAQELETLRQREAKQHTVLFFSATVFDHQFTELRWTGEAGKFRAFSSIDFQYLGGLPEIETADTVYTVMLALATGTAAEAEERARKAPEVSLLPKGRSAWVLAEDSRRESTPVLTALDAIHTYYEAHRVELIRAYEQRVTAEAERQRQLQANPPTPKTSIIRYWRKPTPVTQPARQEDGK